MLLWLKISLLWIEEITVFENSDCETAYKYYYKTIPGIVTNSDILATVTTVDTSIIISVVTVVVILKSLPEILLANILHLVYFYLSINFKNMLF